MTALRRSAAAAAPTESARAITILRNLMADFALVHSASQAKGTASHRQGPRNAGDCDTVSQELTALSTKSLQSRRIETQVLAAFCRRQTLLYQTWLLSNLRVELLQRPRIV